MAEAAWWCMGGVMKSETQTLAERWRVLAGRTMRRVNLGWWLAGFCPLAAGVAVAELQG